MSKVQKFRKKPVVVEVMQYTGRNATEIGAWMGAPQWSEGFADDELSIKTLEGEMQAFKGDWIIKGVAGEFYPCKPDIFELTYEAVDIKGETS